MEWGIPKSRRRRNYAEGAGGFKGIDALPLTGQYTHYALDKKTGKPDMSRTPRPLLRRGPPAETYNGALGVDIHEKDHQTLEMAKAAWPGGTGNVSTAVQYATPAVLVAPTCVNATVRQSDQRKMPDERAGKRRQRLDYGTAAERAS